jgi:hypothetical protein
MDAFLAENRVEDWCRGEWELSCVRLERLRANFALGLDVRLAACRTAQFHSDAPSTAPVESRAIRRLDVHINPPAANHPDAPLSPIVGGSQHKGTPP